MKRILKGQGLLIRKMNAKLKGSFFIKVLQYLIFMSTISFFGCNQKLVPQLKDKNLNEYTEVTITVNGDEGVDIKAINTFTIKKNLEWKDVKHLAQAIITLKENLKFDEWCIGDENGEALTDDRVLSESTTIFATSLPLSGTIKYKIEHWQENADNNEYTKIEEEMKDGMLGKKTRAGAKVYKGFSSQPFKQEEIGVTSSTIVKIQYKRKITSLLLDLRGGTTTTKLEDAGGGKKFVKGKFGAKVLLTNLQNGKQILGRWQPELPKTFQYCDVPTEHVAYWQNGVNITIKCDERLEVNGSANIYATLEEVKNWKDIEKLIRGKVSLKQEWKKEDYGIYDFRLDDEEGDELNENSEITGEMTVYVRSNYTNFEIVDTVLKKYKGNPPTGRIIIPKEITKLKQDAFGWESKNITAIDVRGCNRLMYMDLGRTSIKNINLSDCTSLIDFKLYSDDIKNIDFSKCVVLQNLTLSGKNITDINLSGCTYLVNVDLGHTSINKIDLSNSTYLTKLRLNSTPVTSVDLSNCKGLKDIKKAFKGCESLTTINFSNCIELKNIGEAFEGCKSLTTINFSGCTSLESISDFDFGRYSLLQDINFSDCTALTSIDIRKASITSIDVSGCSNLTSLNLAQTQIEEINVSQCTKLSGLYVYQTLIKNINIGIKIRFFIYKIKKIL